MARIFKKNPKLNDLRDTIKQYAVDVRALRNKANTKAGSEKHALKMDAKYMGSHHARHHLLAYGLLRGKTREQMEPLGKKAGADFIQEGQSVYTPANPVSEYYLSELMKQYAAPAEVAVETQTISVAVG